MAFTFPPAVSDLQGDIFSQLPAMLDKYPNEYGLYLILRDYLSVAGYHLPSPWDNTPDRPKSFTEALLQISPLDSITLANRGTTPLKSLCPSRHP